MMPGSRRHGAPLASWRARPGRNQVRQ